MIPDSHAEMLTILAAHPAGLKTAEIVSIADDNPKSQIVDSSAASKMIYSMRGAGLVTSWMDAGKNKHKITSKGLAELQEFNDAKTPTVQSTTEISPVSSVDMDDRPQRERQAVETVAETHQDSQLVLDQDQPLQTDEVPRPTVTYDPFSEIYQELQKASAMVKKLPKPKPAPVVKQTREKILMLNLIKNHYELINQDVGELFADMINDYKNWEQCA